MAQTIRTFIAVNFAPAQSLRSLLEELGGMGRAVRPVTPDGMHVTLKFLGDTDLNLIKPIAALLDDVTREVEPFLVTFRGLGAFPRPERPAVVWAGIEGADPLIQIAAALETRLEDFGFPAEQRAFHPHLTLARIKLKPPPALAEMMDAYRDMQFDVQEIAAVHLMQSELTRQGPRYTVMHTAELLG